MDPRPRGVEASAAAPGSDRTLRESEERYRLLLHNLGEGFAMHELLYDEAHRPCDLRFLECNPAFERLIGLRQEQVIGRTVRELLPTIEARWIEQLGAVVATGVPARLEGFAVARGRVCEVRTFRPGPGQLATLFLDATASRDAEREQRQQLAQLEEVKRFRERFVDTLSHELRTPLAAMASSLEVLKNPRANASQRARVTSVLERTVRQQTRIVEDLLDLSRIIHGKTELSCEPLDLRDIVSAQIDAIALSARRDQLALSAELPELPVPVIGDAARLSQAISNLLDNALRFTEPGGAITVTVASAGGEAIVRVADTGIGVPPRLLPKLFEPFRQANNSLTRSRGGLGIGLTIARSLAWLHGGTLDGFSEGIDHGSTFELRLPIGAAPDAALAARGPGRRILVVEDSADLQLSMTILLELMGHTVIAAADGATALALAKREQPEVALVDIGLPDIDGYEVARRLRADAATAPLRLIALTGYGAPEYRGRALAAGFDHHLTKPVEEPELRQALEGR